MKKNTMLACWIALLVALPLSALAQGKPAPAEESDETDGATEVDDEESAEDEGEAYDEEAAEAEETAGEEEAAEDEGTENAGEGEEEETVGDEGTENAGEGEEVETAEEEETANDAGKESSTGKDDGAATHPEGKKGAGKDSRTGTDDGAATHPDDKKSAGKESSAGKGDGAATPVKILKKSTGKNGRRHFTAIGAAPIDREDTALRVAVGYPEFQALYHMPYDRDLEWAVGGGVFYGLNAQTAGDITGGMVLGEGRWRFFHDQDHSIALVAAPVLMLGAGERQTVLGGIVLDFPGVTYDYEIKGEHHAVLGFHIPWGVFFSRDGTAARIPFVFKMGMEFAVSQAVHVFVTSELGVDVWAGELPDEILSRGAYLFARGLAGAAFTL